MLELFCKKIQKKIYSYRFSANDDAIIPLIRFLSVGELVVGMTRSYSCTLFLFFVAHSSDTLMTPLLIGIVYSAGVFIVGAQTLA